MLTKQTWSAYYWMMNAAIDGGSWGRLRRWTCFVSRGTDGWKSQWMAKQCTCTCSPTEHDGSLMNMKMSIAEILQPYKLSPSSSWAPVGAHSWQLVSANVNLYFSNTSEPHCLIARLLARRQPAVMKGGRSLSLFLWRGQVHETQWPAVKHYLFNFIF